VPALALLFLVAEQHADAREAARSLRGVRIDNLLRSAVIESVYDLATERFENIIERADRLRRARVSYERPSGTSATDALYGLCWSGIVQLVAQLLDQAFPEMQFSRFESPQDTFDQVVTLATEELNLDIRQAAPAISTFAGPRHLARLLRHVASDLGGAGIVEIASPGGADAQFWSRWLRYRAQTKPVLWRNHRAALATGILETGRSAVLVLPTGAGKTTLSELKVAATLARGKKVLFLVPTLALVDQLRDELAETFPRDVGDVEVSADGDLTALVTGPELRAIEVMTPERCLALLSHSTDAIEEVGLIVFDECHLLSPKGGGNRSLDAMLCLLHALKRAPDADLLLLSAMLTNASEFAGWIQKTTGRPCSAYENPWKPSRQARGVVVYRRRDLNNVGVVQEMIPYGLFGLHQNWNPGIPADTRLVELSNDPVTVNLSVNGYVTPNANGVANSFAVQAVNAGIKTIVFVQQADYAPSNAKKIAAHLQAIGPLTPGEASLWNTIVAEMGGAEFSLVQPASGALPHNGDMIPQERRLVESLFKRTDGAAVIVATPTLAQGMNLPAQFAILAGDKRQDEEGRKPLEPHEILNAAGRAGRAGHLANGVVLLIPDPVVGFSEHGAETGAFDKLRTLLPRNDQCVPMEDPVTVLLDRIQMGDLNNPAVRYFASRIRAGEVPENAVDNAISMVRRSFAAFKAQQANATADFEQKLEALRGILATDNTNADVTTIAASTGLPDGPLITAQDLFEGAPASIPNTILGWADWLVDFFQSDVGSYEALLGSDAPTVNYVVRGKKKGGHPTAQEFGLLKEGLHAWLTGRPLREIETALGVPNNKLKCCPRARDLILKLANRSLYLICASMVELARSVLDAQGLVIPQPSVLETLAVAIRKGLDTPDKVAFAYRRPSIRSRVLLHSSFASDIGEPMILHGQDYATVLTETTARLTLLPNG
jgi:ATP-dependent RNA helicase HelY